MANLKSKLMLNSIESRVNDFYEVNRFSSKRSQTLARAAVVGLAYYNTKISAECMADHFGVTDSTIYRARGKFDRLMLVERHAVEFNHLWKTTTFTTLPLAA